MRILTWPCFFVLFMSACQREEFIAEEKNGTLISIPGHSVALGKLQPPIVIPLSSKPKPRRISIPQSNTPKIQKATIAYPARYYTSDQGLPSNNVVDIRQDPFGNMWFATNTGASQYNGAFFRNFGPQLLIDSSLADILLEKNGALWFGMYPVGVARFDGKTFVNYATEHGLIGNEISCSAEDRSGNLWFGSDHGLFQFRGNGFTRYATQQGLPANNVQRLALDHSGNLWIATPAGASKYNGHTFVNFTTASGLPSNEINDLAVDGSGNLWFGTTRGISKYDGNKFLNFSTNDGLSQDKVTAIAINKKGVIWVATESGLDKFDGKKFQPVSDIEGLATATKKRLFVDQAENLWFGTGGSGAVELLENGLTLFKAEQGFVGPVIQDSKKNFWIAGQDGVTKFDGSSFIKYTSKDGLLSDRIGSLHEAKDGRIWMGGRKGVSVFDGQSFLNYTDAQGFSGHGENSIVEDKAGNLWFIGTGVSKFDGTSITNFGKEQGFNAQSYLGVLEDRHGNLWFASPQGVTRYDGQNVTTYGQAREFGSEVVWAIQEDSAGNLWFSSDGGLTRYDGATFLRYTQNEGLPSDLINQVAFISKGIAIGTSRGLAVLKGYKHISNIASNDEPLLAPQNKLSNAELLHYRPIFETYNNNTGYMIGNVFITKEGLYVDHDENIWVRTYDNKARLLRFNYSEVPRKKPPTVHIHEVQIDSHKIPWYEIALEKKLFDTSVPKTSGRLKSPNVVEEVTTFGAPLNERQKKQVVEEFGDIEFRAIAQWSPIPLELQLPYNHNSITLSFAAAEPNQPESIAYQYKLEGQDKNWSQTTRATSASYSSIPEGEYKFQVKAKSASGIWGEPTVYVFTVLPPWYRTWWAYLFYGILAVTGLYALYRWRTAVLRKRQKELEELYRSAERFLPKNFLQILKKERFQDVNLGDSAKVEKQIMFSDIRGFTTLTEKLGPERTALILNKYMGYMAPIVREYDGVVGQFLGDGILAFFEPKPEMAIDAALVMKKALASFNKDLAEYDIKPVEIGIGLTLGQAVFSIIGEKERLEGHVIADTVNLSARIESLNKYYQTSFLITNSVYDKIADRSQYLIRLIDKVIVAGKDQPVNIYEVNELPPADVLHESRTYIALFDRAFAEYEKGNFARAEELFNECKKQNAKDHVVNILVHRCLQFQKSGTPQGWDGIFKLTEK